MSLLNVPFVRFTPVACSLSRPSASSTSLERSRWNPCASALWSGMSGCFPNPTPHVANFCTHMNEEHTPINLPDSHRNFPRRDDATIIYTPDDTEGLQHSGASSSSKFTAASRVPTALGSWGNCLWKQMADYESVDSRSGIRETGANLDRESVVSTFFSSQSEGKRDRDQNVVHSSRDRKSPQNPWTEKLTRSSEEREWLIRNCIALRQKLRREIGKREILTSLFKSSIKSLNLNDFSDIRQVDGQIMLREINSACMETWNWEIGSSQEDHARDCRGIEELRRNCCEETDRAKTSNGWWIFCASREECHDRESIVDSDSGIAEQSGNPLPDARGFYDPESGISSGATHVPPSPPPPLPPPPCYSEFQNLAALRFWIAAWTQNGTGVTRNVFERPPAQEGLPSTIFHNTGLHGDEESEMKRESLNTSIPSDHFQSRSGMLNRTAGTYSHSGMMDYPRIPITELNLGKFLTFYRISKLESQLQDWSMIQEQPIRRSPCTGSKKLRLPHQLTNLWHRDRFWDEQIPQTTICLMGRLRLHW